VLGMGANFAWAGRIPSVERLSTASVDDRRLCRDKTGYISAIRVIH
jgi:hypothetical protein